MLMMDYELKGIKWSGLGSWAKVGMGVRWGDTQSHVGVRIWALKENQGLLDFLQSLKDTGRIEIDFSEAEG